MGSAGAPPESRLELGCSHRACVMKSMLICNYLLLDLLQLGPRGFICRESKEGREPFSSQLSSE